MGDIGELSTRGGRRIAFEDLGSGPPLVLGHSFLCSRAMWAEQVPALAERHRVVNLDYPGHGESGPVDGPLSLGDLAQDVLDILDRLGIERAIWVGLSLGGMVALHAALQARERVTGLVLLDSDAGAESRWGQFQYAMLGGVARVAGMRPVLRETRRRMFGATTRRTRPELVDDWSRQWTRVDIPSMLRCLEAISRREDLTPHLRTIAAPALVGVGAEDVSLPPERSRRMAALLPHARYHEIPEAGHLSALEQPRPVTDAMLEFLRTVA